MADEADFASEVEQDSVARKINEILSKPMLEGKPGDCDLCGEWSGRLKKI